MTKAPKVRAAKGQKERGGAKAPPEIELHEDAWTRFEQFIKDVAKAGPKHREAAKPKPKKEKRS